MLGWHTVNEAAAGFEGGAFEELPRHVASTYLEAPQTLAFSAQASRGCPRPAPTPNGPYRVRAGV